MTPYECFVGSKPNVSNLKVFGCTAYMQIPKELRKRWDAKSKRCIFIGFCVSSNGYRLWDPESRRVYLSRDVIFLEQDFDGRVKRLKEQSASKGSSEILSENYEEEAEDRSNDGNNDENSVAEEVLVHSKGDLRRSEKARRPPEREGIITGTWSKFADYENASYRCADDVIGEPKTVKQALESPDKSKWKKELDSEYKFVVEYNTWNLVKPQKGQNIVDSKWVFKVKYDADEFIERYKTRLVAKGFTQTPGIDFEETFSLVVRYTSIRTLLAIINQLDLELHQMDVSTAFLNGELKEDIYMS